MTLPGPQQNTPRRPVPSPRKGALRRYGTPSPPAGNAVTDSGATSWYDAHDGSGLQQIPSRIGVGVAVLGSTTGVDTNDPTWGSGASPTPFWGYDATDDYINLDSSDTPVFDATTGAHTVLVLFTCTAASKWIWDTSGSATRYARITLAAGGGVLASVRGATASATTAASASVTGGSIQAAGLVVDNGNLYKYLYGVGRDASPTSITGVGDLTSSLGSPPRVGAQRSSVVGVIQGNVFAVVTWKNQALSGAALDTVAAYLLGTF